MQHLRTCKSLPRVHLRLGTFRMLRRSTRPSHRSVVRSMPALVVRSRSTGIFAFQGSGEPWKALASPVLNALWSPSAGAEGDRCLAIPTLRKSPQASKCRRQPRIWLIFGVSSLSSPPHVTDQGGDRAGTSTSSRVDAVAGIGQVSLEFRDAGWVE